MRHLWLRTSLCWNSHRWWSRHHSLYYGSSHDRNCEPISPTHWSLQLLANQRWWPTRVRETTICSKKGAAIRIVAIKTAVHLPHRSKSSISHSSHRRVQRPCSMNSRRRSQVQGLRDHKLNCYRSHPVLLTKWAQMAVLRTPRKSQNTVKN